MNLSTKQKQHLKGLAHPLKPVVLLGSNGLTEGVLAEIEQALEHHELIKVKIATEDRETKTLIVEAIVRETGACNVSQAMMRPLPPIWVTTYCDQPPGAAPRSTTVIPGLKSLSLCCISSSLNQARERNPFFCAC